MALARVRGCKSGYHVRLYQGTRAPGAAGDLGPGPLLFEKNAW